MTWMRFSLAVALMVLVAPALATAGSVTPNVIMGTGVGNGGWTLDRQNGVELGLRGKLRHNASGLPENTYNWDGVDTYLFNPGVAPTQSFPTAEWSFEWSINSSWDGTSGDSLNSLTYELSMTSSTGTSITGFDPINDLNPGVGLYYWDHSIGDNSTLQSAGVEAVDVADYAGLIASNNVAQNSWKPSWFVTGFDPTVTGSYDFVLEAFNLQGLSVARTGMTVQVGPTAAVPLPSAAWMGLALLGGLGFVRRIRRK